MRYKKLSASIKILLVGVALVFIGVLIPFTRYIMVRSLMSPQLVKHFPKIIPLDASNVRIYYTPQFLQGGDILQVRLKLDPMRISQLREEFKRKSKYQFRGGDTNIHANIPNGVPTTFFYTSGAGGVVFPVTFDLFVLDAKSYDKGPKWNHGISYGVAIDRTNSEIVYWAEEW